MSNRLPGVSASSNRRWIALSVPVIIVIALGVYWLFFHHSKSSNQQVDPSPSYQQFQSVQTKEADQAANDNQGDNAVSLYLLAAHNARLAQGVDAAISVLQNGIQKVPNAPTVWELYSVLADTAQAKGDKSLQKQSLTTAIQKAGVAGSGATQDDINSMQQQLDKLK